MKRNEIKPESKKERKKERQERESVMAAVDLWLVLARLLLPGHLIWFNLISSSRFVKKKKMKKKKKKKNGKKKEIVMIKQNKNKLI